MKLPPRVSRGFGGVVQISGEMKFGETASASWAVSRAYGFGAGLLLAYFAAVVVVMVIVVGLVEAFVPPELMNLATMVVLGGAAAGMIIAMSRLRRWRVTRALRERGQSADTPVTFTIDDAALELRTADATSRLGWSGVTDLLAAKTHWIFLVGGMGYCVPRRFFPDATAERAFVRAALSRMSDGARARSTKAAAYVAWE